MPKNRTAKAKFPEQVFVEWSDRSDPNSANDRYLIVSEQPPSEENDAIDVAVYKLDRIVKVVNETKVVG